MNRIKKITVKTSYDGKIDNIDTYTKKKTEQYWAKIDPSFYTDELCWIKLVFNYFFIPRTESFEVAKEYFKKVEKGVKYTKIKFKVGLYDIIFNFHLT